MASYPPFPPPIPNLQTEKLGGKTFFGSAQGAILANQMLTVGIVSFLVSAVVVWRHWYCLLLPDPVWHSHRRADRHSGRSRPQTSLGPDGGGWIQPVTTVRM